MKKAKGNFSWDVETEVAVVGYGLAGAVSAVCAHDAGAKALILEKSETPGGSSALAGGGVKIAEDVEGARQYLTRTQGGRCESDLIEVMAKGMYEIPEFLKKMAEADQAEFRIVTHGDRVKQGGATGYPFPGRESFSSITVTKIPGFSGYPWVRGTQLNGQRLVKLLEDNVVHRGIEVHFSSPVKELITGDEGEITGLVAEKAGRTFTVRANRAVILACGGFQFNETLKKESFEAIPVYSMGHLGNTGDGILMSQKAGAAMWHMWHFHGSYGFKFPEFACAFRIPFPGTRISTRRMPWINVDRFGKRFMNEYHRAPQDTMHRPLQHFDPEMGGYSRIPCYLIFDEEGRKLGPIAKPMATTKDLFYDWSQDNSAEIGKGWIVKGETLGDLAGKLGIDADNLRITVERWNDLVNRGEDLDFQRPSGTMCAIGHPPFYGATAWPICTNTQGGPKHNALQQVLDPWDRPIPRLYAVGELGSFYGHLYLLGGNLAECIVGGRIAGEKAAEEPLPGS